MELIKKYNNDPIMLKKFYSFIKKVFPGIDFKEWQNRGFWSEKYVPFSFVENSEIVANVCVTELDLIINGNSKKGIQIGAVATLPEYRNKGYSRRLMEYVLEAYNSVDVMFLYANESVLDFYPRFGFKNYFETKFEKSIEETKPNGKLKKLDIGFDKDFQIILELLSNRRPLTKIFGADNYFWITMWHIINSYKNNLYYLEEKSLLAIMEVSDQELNILELFSFTQINLDEILKD